MTSGVMVSREISSSEAPTTSVMSSVAKTRKMSHLSASRMRRHSSRTPPAEQQGPGAPKLWASSGQEEAAAVTVGSILSLLWFSMAVRTASLSVSGSLSSTWFSRRTLQLKDAWSTLLWSKKVSYCFNCSNRPMSWNRAHKRASPAVWGGRQRSRQRVSMTETTA